MNWTEPRTLPILGGWRFFIWYLAFRSDVCSSFLFHDITEKGNLSTSSRDLRSVRSVFRIATNKVPLQSGRKRERPDSLPSRERIADTVRTQSVRCAPYKAPQWFWFNTNGTIEKSSGSVERCLAELCAWPKAFCLSTRSIGSHFELPTEGQVVYPEWL
jgi:hypothetical protein